MNKRNQPSNSFSYQSAIGIAIVSSVFAIIIAALLVNSLYHKAATDPVRSAELEKMKEQAKANPSDTVLADLILETDKQLRRDQFARLYFLQRGTVLFVITLVLLVGSIIWALSHHSKQPELVPQGDLKKHQISQASLTRTSVTVAIIVLCSGALFWVLHAPQNKIKPSEQPVSLYTPTDKMQDHWPVFRGPGGLGVCQYKSIPDSWDGQSGENILWKTSVPLPGHNSPVVWDDRIFITGATEDKQQVFCFKTDSGQMLWARDVSISPSADRDDMEVMEDTGYAACTAVTDGKRVCAIFAGGDIGCFTIEGELLWEKHLGVPESAYGYAASLTAYEQNVIVQWDVGYDEGDESKSKLIALNWLTGKESWQTHRPVPNSWSSPTVAKVGDAYQVLTCGYPFVIAYDPKSGNELYRAECIEGDIASTPVLAANALFAIEPYNKLVAINTQNAQGDITETHILWQAEEAMPDICSPVSDGVHVWTLTTEGDLSCFDISDGSLVYTKSLGKYFQASPTLVKDHLYLLAENGTMLVAAIGPEYKELGRSELGEKCYACPAFQDGRIYIRAKDNLYAIGTAE